MCTERPGKLQIKAASISVVQEKTRNPEQNIRAWPVLKHMQL